MACQTLIMSQPGYSTTGGTYNTGVIYIPQKTENWQGMGVPLLVNFSGGGPATGVVNVQVTCDPNAAPNSANFNLARWNLHDVLQNLTGDKNDSLAFVVYAIRLWVVSISGSVQLQVGIPDQL